MNRIRLRVIILALWLAVLYNAERLLNPIGINSIAYTFALAMVVIILLLPKIIHIPFWLILIIQVIVFYLLKALTGGLEGPAIFALTITEICAITATSIVVQWVSFSLGEFEAAVQNILIGRREKMPEPTAAGQGSIYREVRRARNHHRPLSIIAVAVDEKSIKIDLDRMVKEAVLTMMKQYKLANLSRTLCNELEDCAVIVQASEHFIVALPETTPEDLPFVIERLRKQAEDQVSIKLKIGTAVLPEDSFTFEGLIDKATREMEGDLETKQFIELDEKPLEQH